MVKHLFTRIFKNSALVINYLVFTKLNSNVVMTFKVLDKVICIVTTLSTHLVYFRFFGLLIILKYEPEKRKDSFPFSTIGSTEKKRLFHMNRDIE